MSPEVRAGGPQSPIHQSLHPDRCGDPRSRSRIHVTTIFCGTVQYRVTVLQNPLNPPLQISASLESTETRGLTKLGIPVNEVKLSLITEALFLLGVPCLGLGGLGGRFPMGGFTRVKGVCGNSDRGNLYCTRVL